jgi:hypothetical protein
MVLIYVLFKKNNIDSDDVKYVFIDLGANKGILIIIKIVNNFTT